MKPLHYLMWHGFGPYRHEIIISPIISPPQCNTFFLPRKKFFVQILQILSCDTVHNQQKHMAYICLFASLCESISLNRQWIPFVMIPILISVTQIQLAVTVVQSIHISFRMHLFIYISLSRVRNEHTQRNEWYCFRFQYVEQNYSAMCLIVFHRIPAKFSFQNNKKNI